MANIFGGETPFGMPDFSTGMPQEEDPNKAAFDRTMMLRNQDEAERQARRIQTAQTQLAQSGYRKPALNQIGQSMQQPNNLQAGGRNVVYQPSMSDYQRAQVALGRDRLAQQRDLVDERGDITSRQIGERGAIQDQQIERRGDIGSRQIDERGDITSRQIGERGAITDRQIGARGDITSRQIGERGEIQKGLQDTRGEQNLAGIAARVAGQKEVQSNKPATPISQTQQRTGISNAAREIINTRPDLAKFIQIDPNTGDPINSAQPGTVEYEQINSALYGDNKKDINLPSAAVKAPSKAAKPKTPTSKTPTAGDPLGIR